MALLRDLQISGRHFWKQSASEQLSQKAFDKDSNGFKRSLPGNEVSTLALNEIARARGYGLFYYLPSREIWKTNEDEALLPVSRVPHAPGANYPTMIFLRYKWSAAAKASYDQMTHRQRYLDFNAMINPPTAGTPIYPVQYVNYAICPTYYTAVNSIIVFATSDKFYVISTALAEQVIGRWNKSYPASGQDPAMRFNQPRYLWQPAKNDAERKTLKAMEPFEVGDLEAVYDQVLAQCHPFADPAMPSLNAEELKAVIPRPVSPENGLALGTPLAAGTTESLDAADAPATRKAKKRRIN